MQRIVQIVDSILQKLPPAWCARLEHILLPSLRERLRGPLNGQRVRQQMVLDILHAVPFGAIVETGTFRGSTTEFFAKQTPLPIFTAELLPQFYHYSRLRLQPWKQIHLFQGDSRDFLRRLAKDPTFPKGAVFFYLDAHWYEDLPLREEVEIIFKRWKEAVVMIDDFEVPDDPGYAYDTYQQTKPVNLDVLPSLPSLGAKAYYPAVPSREETGYARGCIVITHNALTDSLNKISLLRPA